MKKVLFAFVILVSGTLAACESSEDEVLVAPEERIQGRWIIDNSQILGQTVPGDGSYLEFDACGTDCGGIDYMAADDSQGTFTYVLNAEGTTVTIQDDTPDGGAYNGQWDILEFTNSSMVITGNTILGTLRMELSKQ